MFSSENHEGRLVELRVVTPVTTREIVELQKTHLEVTGRIDGDYVVAVDMRRGQVFPPEITERFIGLMTRLNPRLERSAILINESAVLGLQAEHAMATAGHAHRRAFRDRLEMEQWLGEVLSERERSRLRSFLIEGAEGLF